MIICYGSDRKRVMQWQPRDKEAEAISQFVMFKVH